jgi:hypothetical protein
MNRFNELVTVEVGDEKIDDHGNLTVTWNKIQIIWGSLIKKRTEFTTIANHKYYFNHYQFITRTQNLKFFNKNTRLKSNEEILDIQTIDHSKHLITIHCNTHDPTKYS